MQLKEGYPFEAGRINVRLHYEIPSFLVPLVDISKWAQHSFLLSPRQSQSSRRRRHCQSIGVACQTNRGLTILDTSTRFVPLPWPPVAMVSVQVFSVHFSYMPLQYSRPCCYFWPPLCCSCSSSRLDQDLTPSAQSSALCRAGGQQQFDRC